MYLCRHKGKWVCEAPWKLSMHLSACVHPHACILGVVQHVRTTGRTIKVSNYSQTNKLILFSQTNELADFDGVQRRLRNVWRAQTAAWKTDDTSLIWFISAQLDEIMLMAISSFNCFSSSKQSVPYSTGGGVGSYLIAFHSAGARCTSQSSQSLINFRQEPH